MVTQRKKMLIRLLAGFVLLPACVVLLISLVCLGNKDSRSQGFGPFKVGLFKVGLFKVGSLDAGPLEVDTLDAGPLEVDPAEVEQSYHGQLGYGTGLGMVDKWCPLSYFKFDEEGGVDGWVARKCDECHIGAKWNPNKPDVNCLSCHPSINQVDGDYVVEDPTIKECYTCHIKETEKRGDLFDPSHDVHLAAGSEAGSGLVPGPDPGIGPGIGFISAPVAAPVAARVAAPGNGLISAPVPVPGIGFISAPVADSVAGPGIGLISAPVDSPVTDFFAGIVADTQTSCQSCHTAKNHQIAKGKVIDTSEPTKTDPVVSCTMSACHSFPPHTKAAEEGKHLNTADRNTADRNTADRSDRNEAEILDQHCQKIACETCHTDNRTRSDLALLSRDWTQYRNGKPVSQYHEAGWVPEHKWYDGNGPSADYKYVPILDYTERMDSPGAKIYPFNVITVTWFIKSEGSDLDDIIISKKVKAAGKLSDPADPSSLLITTEADMRAYDDPDDVDSEPDYPNATMITREINFNLSHSIVSKDNAPACTDCHGKTGRKLLDWEKLGYKQDDPRQDGAGR